jgi:GDP-4-dehydro-6-deoxy-D-mannose reductase
MRALVTGARGFVGRHLVHHLTAAGDEVVELDRTDAGGVDVADPDAIGAALADARPEVVYHLAGFADVGASWDEPAEAFRVNAEGTLHVLTAARSAAVRRVLVVGSADVYGTVAETDLPLDEDQPLRPTSPYAASKVAADFLALQAWLGHGLETVRMRAFNHLGPGQRPRFVAAALAERVARNERAGHDEVEVGNVTPRRDFTDVRDVVRAYRMAMVDGEAGAVYHVCSGRDTSIRELAEQLLALAARPMRLAADPALQRPVDLPVLRGDAGRLRAATGWVPEIPLERTLADLLDDARARLAASPTG